MIYPSFNLSLDQNQHNQIHVIVRKSLNMSCFVYHYQVDLKAIAQKISYFETPQDVPSYILNIEEFIEKIYIDIDCAQPFLNFQLKKYISLQNIAVYNILNYEAVLK